MKLFVLCYSIVISAALAPMVAFANPFPEVETLQIESDVLDEMRTIQIYAPERYFRDGTLPIVFVTDSKSQFPLVTGYLTNLSGDWPRLPPMVVVGIEHSNRNRDLVPREDSRFPGTGGGDKFSAFLREELIPAIEEKMGGSSAKILVGHSFGGVNAINILLTDTNLFDAYIAIGTSTWVSDRVLFERANQAFDDGSALATWLYMAVAERDGGATVPDGEAFAALFEARAPEALDWRFEIIPRTDHFSAVPIGLDRAFAEIFPVWQQKPSIMDLGREEAVSIPVWFEQEKHRLGWRFMPHAWDMMIAAFELHAEGHTDSALVLLDETIAYHPHLADLYLAKGDLLNATSDSIGAAAAWNTALALLQSEDARAPRIDPVLSRLSALPPDGAED